MKIYRKIYCTLHYTCNNNCLICAIAPEKRKKSCILLREEIIKFLQMIKAGRNDIIELSGGEPTIWKDIIQLCQDISSNFDAELVILSNSREFKNKNFVKELSCYIKRVVTAIYSPFSNIHDFITQRKGSFKETMKGLKNLEDVGVGISVKTFPLKQNYTDIPKFIEFCSKIFENPWIYINGLEIRGHAEINKEKIAIRYSDATPFIEKALDMADELGLHVSLFMMPLCVFDPYYWKYYGKTQVPTAMNLEFLLPDEKDFKKEYLIERLEKCKGCVFSKFCLWGRPHAYVKLFGDDEIKPYKTGD